MTLVTAAVAFALTVAMPSADLQEAAQTPDGLIEWLYDMVSFGPGPEPDWEMFRQVFLEDAVLVFSPRGTQPMRVMDVDGFIRDWQEFYRDADLESTGFTETIGGMSVRSFGGLAHAFVIFEPRLGPPEAPMRGRGLDSIELAHDGERWWIAAITTDFESPENPIPEEFVR